jgi:16S rRNA (uracil1498-N3)-methyltransferase
MHVFYASELSGSIHILDAEESRHCIKVLRLKSGDSIKLTDGKGKWYQAVLSETHPRHCILQVEEQTFAEPKMRPALHMAVAPTKNIDRFEWFLEKATECGISEITPLICANSERTVIKPNRLEKILVSAMKQSMRAWLPVLHPPIRFGAFIQQAFPGLTCIAHCAEGTKVSLQQLNGKGENTLILIGPEGDFTAGEINQARESGFKEIQLGNYRLRTETAALAACLGFHFINNNIS